MRKKNGTSPDAEMPWLSDEGDLKGLTSSLVRQTAKSLAGRVSFALYSKHFEIIRADTQDLKELAYLLRFQVYVQEHGFEKAEDHPGDREKDEYDDRSMHILLRHRSSGIIVGTARMVLPNKDDLTDSFPVQAVSSHPMMQDAEIAAHATEFSRLAISRERLKHCHVGSRNSNSKISQMLAKQLTPYLSVGLIAGVFEISAENGYPTVLAIMEPFMVRNLGRIGLDLPFVDTPVEYHGLRHPCAIPSLHDICAAMKKKDRAAWEIVTNKGRTQELALTAQTRSEDARRAVAQAYRLAKRPATIALRAPGSRSKPRSALHTVTSMVNRPTRGTVSRRR
jgi:N-acyl amino acid synthase of PEP-CTERM/exosortase system